MKVIATDYVPASTDGVRFNMSLPWAHSSRTFDCPEVLLERGVTVTQWQLFLQSPPILLRALKKKVPCYAFSWCCYPNDLADKIENYHQHAVDVFNDDVLRPLGMYAHIWERDPKVETEHYYIRYLAIALCEDEIQVLRRARLNPPIQL